ncbi:MAG: hypothetical protein A2719_02080 [Candidatus Ryanbacteria bacterium RIFCSPHIGHO2_01_FULL_45_22]|uniref:Uncharacterized protein n=1 Tax=Candidatus Ryanbacteria bacterium RIFCSPHIGHO2_01_FULL_45_22 TaxID=1802114 RepID=A0A1G2FXI9_9BACT|nr:MAG: hypothetical protein A2719_02080 [Candidatus Ryanbacteria bacterium RIFCSPHIGHO2_01_FULL_45_22]
MYPSLKKRSGCIMQEKEKKAPKKSLEERLKMIVSSPALARRFDVDDRGIVYSNGATRLEAERTYGRRG